MDLFHSQLTGRTGASATGPIKLVYPLLSAPWGLASRGPGQLITYQEATGQCIVRTGCWWLVTVQQIPIRGLHLPWGRYPYRQVSVSIKILLPQTAPANIGTQSKYPLLRCHRAITTLLVSTKDTRPAFNSTHPLASCPLWLYLGLGSFLIIPEAILQSLPQVCDHHPCITISFSWLFPHS